MSEELEPWKPDYSVTPRRIVCAALFHRESNRVVSGVRHWDNVMRNQIKASEGLTFWFNGVEDGFLDQFGQFLNREEAWIVAFVGSQIVRDVGTPGTLYSENLY